MHYVDEAFPRPARSCRPVPAEPGQAALDHQADGRTRAHLLHDAHLRDRLPSQHFAGLAAGGIGGGARQVARQKRSEIKRAGGRPGLDAAPVVEGAALAGALLEGIEAANGKMAVVAGRCYGRWRTPPPPLMSGGSTSSSSRACGRAAGASPPGTSAFAQRPSFKTAVEDWMTAADQRYANEPDSLGRRWGDAAGGVTKRATGHALFFFGITAAMRCLTRSRLFRLWSRIMSTNRSNK